MSQHAEIVAANEEALGQVHERVFGESLAECGPEIVDVLAERSAALREAQPYLHRACLRHVAVPDPNVTTLIGITGASAQEVEMIGGTLIHHNSLIRQHKAYESWATGGPYCDTGSHQLNRVLDYERRWEVDEPLQEEPKVLVIPVRVNRYYGAGVLVVYTPDMLRELVARDRDHVFREEVSGSESAMNQAYMTFVPITEAMVGNDLATALQASVRADSLWFSLDTGKLEAVPEGAE